MFAFNPKLSIHIPSLLPTTTEEMIKEAFARWNLGKVDHVNIFIKKKRPFNMAFVHFEYWFDNVAARNMQQRILDPNKCARFVYDDPLYWILATFEHPKQKLASPKRLVPFLSEYCEQDMDDTEPDENGMTELDYMRCEEFDIMQEEEETWRDYSKAIQDGITLEDTQRQEEYLQQQEEYALFCEEALRRHPSLVTM